MKRYALFGGTFDPFTPAHIAIVKKLLNMRDNHDNIFIDKVWIAPTIVNYYRKSKHWLSDNDRCKVIEDSLSDIKRGIDWDLYDYDIRMKALFSDDKYREEFISNYRFIDTLLSFKTKICNEDDEIYVVLGSDSYNQLSTWHMWKEIVSISTKLIVVKGRDIVNLSSYDGVSPIIINIDDKYSNCSATKYREKYSSFPDGKDLYVNDVVIPNLKGYEVLLNTPIFDVVKGKPVDEVGGLEPIRVNAPNWVMVIVEKDKKFLITRQLRLGSMTYVDEFPCGMVEPNELPIYAAKRELEEETGIRIVDDDFIKFLSKMNPNPAFMTNMMYLFYVNLDDAKYENVEKKLDEHERIGTYWYDSKEFIATVLNEASIGSHPVPAMLISAIALYQNAMLK